jgi:hypothetical protein
MKRFISFHFIEPGRSPAIPSKQKGRQFAGLGKM